MYLCLCMLLLSIGQSVVCSSSLLWQLQLCLGYIKLASTRLVKELLFSCRLYLQTNLSLLLVTHPRDNFEIIILDHFGNEA